MTLDQVPVFAESKAVCSISVTHSEHRSTTGLRALSLFCSVCVRARARVLYNV